MLAKTRGEIGNTYYYYYYYTVGPLPRNTRGFETCMHVIIERVILRRVDLDQSSVRSKGDALYACTYSVR